MNVGFGPLVHVCIKAHLFCVSAQILVPGSTTTALLQQLVPNTDYNVGVVALYSDGEGPAIMDAGKTCKNPGQCVLLAALRRAGVFNKNAKPYSSSRFCAQCLEVPRGTCAYTTPPPLPSLSAGTMQMVLSWSTASPTPRSQETRLRDM